ARDLALDTEIRFRSASERAEFTRDLTEAVTHLVARYHDDAVPDGRLHRLVVVAHPLLHHPQTQEPS
ncbi:MAG: ArsR family transcriptional regulator, partial [Thermoanaerobaculia bacterium]|nr:ArsR family transcriptional regulator [Thermoanaerobaculia bacterium]